MYRVRLQVEGHAKEFFPGGQAQFDLALPSPATVRELVTSLGVSPDLVMAVFVEGELRDKDTIPPDGATVVLLSPPSGG